MPRPRIDQFWIDQARLQTINHPDWSGAEIRRALQKLKNAPGKVPSDRAIRRVKADIDELSEKEKTGYTVFSWPESMQTHLLPWEASRACLDFLAFLHDHRKGEWWPDPEKPGIFLVSKETEVIEGRPGIALLESFWAVTQAAPNASVSIRLLITASLWLGDLRPAEGCLAYTPWENDSKAAAYSAAIGRKSIVPFVNIGNPNFDLRMVALFRLFGTNDVPDVMDAWRVLCKLSGVALTVASPLDRVLPRVPLYMSVVERRTEPIDTPENKKKKGSKNGKTKTHSK